MIGMDTEKQTKTKTEKNQDDTNWRLLLTAVELYATMSVFERRIHLSKSNTRIVSIQVE